jgi:hypothetical protein
MNKFIIDDIKTITGRYPSKTEKKKIEKFYNGIWYTNPRKSIKFPDVLAPIVKEHKRKSFYKQISNLFKKSPLKSKKKRMKKVNNESITVAAMQDILNLNEFSRKRQRQRPRRFIRK